MPCRRVGRAGWRCLQACQRSRRRAAPAPAPPPQLGAAARGHGQQAGRARGGGGGRRAVRAGGVQLGAGRPVLRGLRPAGEPPWLGLAWLGLAGWLAGRGRHGVGSLQSNRRASCGPAHAAHTGTPCLTSLPLPPTPQQMNAWRSIADMADSRAYGSAAALGSTLFAVGGLQSDMQVRAAGQGQRWRVAGWRAAVWSGMARRPPHPSWPGLAAQHRVPPTAARR